MKTAAAENKKAMKNHGLDVWLLAEMVSAGMVSEGVRINPEIVDV